MRSNALPQLRILVVNDEDLVRDTLTLLLESDRHLVEAAGNGSEALKIFQRGRFDLVLTDYDMASTKGDRLAAAIKALAPRQPVVMVIAYTEAVENDPSLMKNLDGLVPRPFRIETPREAIARALASQRLPPSSPNR
jgi:CheY-like chemotaxis protein